MTSTSVDVDEDETGAGGHGGTGFGRVRLYAPALIAATLIGAVTAYLVKVPCRTGAWNHFDQQFAKLCYSDIYPLYFQRQLADPGLPYLDHRMEYPVVIGAFMKAVAFLVQPVSDPIGRGLAFFDLTVPLLAACGVVAVLATAYLSGRGHEREALIVAFSPAAILGAYINWDLLAVALTALAMACWASRRPTWAGVLFGLAIATKFYPLVLLGPLFLLCLRSGRIRAFAVTTCAAVLTWLVVNLPVALAAPAGWAEFYTFSQERPADWGSIWFFLQMKGLLTASAGDQSGLNMLGTVTMAVACVLIAVIALTAPRRPRLPQLMFLVLAAFLLTNKVWSPQYVLWLVPFVALLRVPRWAMGLWQLAEVGYFVAIWWYLLRGIADQTPEMLTQSLHGIGENVYFAALLGRFGAVLLLCALVVWQIYRPERDPVRAEGADDPAGGELDGAPDRFALRLRRHVRV
ncbi:MAG: DUF2029 domain-containing protein [Streptosporangiales bacterium]|nr:DUF2029 domain-containing protein [Streptosporangiales bacterium]